MNNTQTTYTTNKLIGTIVLLFMFTAFLERSVQEGMFFDGITYASIARNLAIGKGSFWELYYRNSWTFSEHPPLMFGILSVFFRLLGDHFYTEKVYNLFIWIVTIIMLTSFWKKLTGNRKGSGYELLLLVWVIIPTVLWAYPNCLIDCTMAVFDLAAVMILFNTYNKQKNSILALLIAAILMVCATLTKGPVGLFPLAVPFIYHLVYKSKQLPKAIMHTIVLTAIMAGIYLLLWRNDAARHSLQRYLDEQLFAALQGKRENTGGDMGRYALLVELFNQLLPAIAPLALTWILCKALKIQPLKEKHTRHIVFLLLIACCSSLPIMLSVKQRSFYLIPSFIYFAMAIALVAYPYYMALTTRYALKYNAAKAMRYASMIAIAGIGVFLYTKFGKVSRDEQYINDIKVMQTILPEGEKVGICLEMDKDYEFLAYIQRYHSLEVNLQYATSQYILIDDAWCKTNFTDTVLVLGYKPLNAPTKKYKLYKKD
ncbi:hypothetical protein CAP35_09460 [Chitinophagaceae bacterium IBVUCB1]|nr:hypothetical protein CAP35_09460 [Chitinophagaceae bacterium IBVUCB1]